MIGNFINTAIKMGPIAIVVLLCSLEFCGDGAQIGRDEILFF